MDQVSQVKRQFRIEQWRKYIIECQASGMSVRSWCKQNNLSEQTYYKYLRRFRQELCDSLPVPVTTSEGRSEKPVTLPKTGGTSTCSEYKSCCYYPPSQCSSGNK